MQQTETYKLNLIEGSDDFSPQPLNENMEAIEGVLAALEAGQPRIVIGSYPGTGDYGSDNPTSLTFDFKPAAVFIANPCNSGSVTVFIQGSPAAWMSGGSAGGFYPQTVAWEGNSVSWHNRNTFWGTVDTYFDGGCQLNGKNYTYHYVAIG